MRSTDSKQSGMFNYTPPEERIPTNHPLRPLRNIVSEALVELSRKEEALCPWGGRPSIGSKRPIRELLLHGLSAIRRNRLQVERSEHNLLFRWFVGLSADEPVRDHSIFRSVGPSQELSSEGGFGRSVQWRS